MRKNIGISLWGYVYDWSEKNTPDGGRLFHKQYINKLVDYNYNVILLQQNRDKIFCDKHRPASGKMPTYSLDFPKLDLLLCEYRWPTYKNFGKDKTEPDYDRQMVLIEYYYDKCPIIVWDQDLKVDNDFAKKYPKIIFADACLNTGRMQLFYPCHLESDYKIQSSFLNEHYITYCGNNYERYKMFSKYLQNAGKMLKDGVHIYGNWKQFSPERISPIKVKMMFPDVIFHDRVSYDEVEKILNQSFSTLCITKDAYNEKGLVVSRFIEALRCKTLLFGTKEFYGIEKLLPKECIVNDAKTLVEAISELSLKDREELIHTEIDFFNKSGVASLDNFIATLEKVMECR